MRVYNARTATYTAGCRGMSRPSPSDTIEKACSCTPARTEGYRWEAARLQSFPDWFRFLGTANGSPGGLMHKQQQLANAVCPLVTNSIAEFLLGSDMKSGPWNRR